MMFQNINQRGQYNADVYRANKLFETLIKKIPSFLELHWKKKKKNKKCKENPLKIVRSSIKKRKKTRQRINCEIKPKSWREIKWRWRNTVHRNAYEELAPSENRPVHLSCHEAAEASHHDSTIKPCYWCTVARRPRLGTMERRKTAKQTRVTGTR